ncbi:hypothetical protein BDN71DRAFT_754463 [Pleurotus eryngii]|uniref:Uncharacterized protein n=1 Tax=Pleurotus eryngii TaxID=5323 RepID=A0A9P6A3C0_PLEER|nr:hypothetical protein BDN71DRAFT_754463 [Pleurotus eryngii]
MAIHFYDESPSPPGEQLARLKASALLVRSEIPFVVWGEDALAIVHRVLTGLFDQHLLVQDERVADAVELICKELRYAPIDAASDDRWGDYPMYNPTRPFAFDGTPTTLLQHTDLEFACKMQEPDRILVHAASAFNFPLHDLSRSCLNPTPPSPESAEVRFPTVPAFYDTLLDMLFEPPMGYIHFKFHQHLRNYFAYLTTYNVSDEGITKASAPPGEFELIPSCLQVLDEVKDENKPYLARHFLGIRVDREVLGLERLLIRQARLMDEGVRYALPQLPYNFHIRSRGKVSPPPAPKLLEYVHPFQRRLECNLTK